MDGGGDFACGDRRGTRGKLRADPEEMALYSLADRLHMRVADVMAMSVDEYRGWIAYEKIRREKTS